MKKISAEIIADSKNEFGDRITTFVLTFPRFILAELNTHRVFSRNSASSRAIPFAKMVKMVEEDPFIPIAWQKDHKGMQGTEYFDEFQMASHPYNFTPITEVLKGRWLKARDRAKVVAENLSNDGLTKQLCNRLLEPFMWHTAIVTATEFENFFNLRCPQYEFGGKIYKSKKDLIESRHKPFRYEISKGEFLEYREVFDDERFWQSINKGQGEIHIMVLAEAMWDAMDESEPKQLKSGEWHIPFGNNVDENRISKIWSKQIGENTQAVILDKDLPYDRDEDMNSLKVKIATARCARVSYLNFEGKDDYEADIKLHDILLKSGHFSPFEHCANAMNFKDVHGNLENRNDKGWSGNFKGFIQYRKMLEV